MPTTKLHSRLTRGIANTVSHSMQAAYHLLPAVIEAGTRIFVYSGMNGTILPYEGSLAWMSRNPSSQFSAFRQPPVTIPPAKP
nr:hypothetical protein I308_06608 [Cryptococcus tetragattii IND107]